MQGREGDRRVFALAVLCGFETKSFFGSSILELLGREHGLVVLKREFPSRHILSYVERAGLEAFGLEPSAMRGGRPRAEELFLASRRARQRLSSSGNFNYFQSDRELRWSDHILASRVVSFALRLVARASMARRYWDLDLDRAMSELGMTDLVLTGYAPEHSIALATTALRGRRRVWLLINSWKDLYVNSVISFTPTGTFVWSEAMKAQLLEANPHISREAVHVVGNPAFDRFFSYRPVHSLEHYGQKYAFDVSRPLILYSMISPRAYAGERGVIELINQRLAEAYADEAERPLIVLRRNPIDDEPSDTSLFSGDGVRYAEDYFEGSYEHGVYVQAPEGEVEWMDLLFYARVNLNVASTVTLESLLLGTPVINIEFDQEGRRDEGLARYGDAPFYRTLHGRKDVVVAATIERCVEALQGFLVHGLPESDLSAIVGPSGGDAAQRMAAKMIQRPGAGE